MKQLVIPDKIISLLQSIGLNADGTPNWDQPYPYNHPDLLPVALHPLTSFNQIRKIIRIEKPRHLHLSSQPIPTTDEEAQILWPARSDVDLGLRRGRYTDLYLYSKQDVLCKTMIQYMLDSKYDYFTVCNTIISTLIHGFEWFRNLNYLGLFSESVEDMTKNCSALTTIIKTKTANFPNWNTYVELGGLSGFRNLPFPGFDYMKEVDDLAHGGLPHWWSEDKEWYDAYVMKTCFKIPDKFNPKLSFLEYIESGIWATSGSSSIGKYEVEVEYGKKKKIEKIKCRKNMVLDVFSPLELYNMCMISKNQENSVLVKSELGKVRLAVSSDLLTYLKMAYILYCSSLFYQKIDDTVGGEDVNSQISRLARTVILCENHYGMPFDYKGFDHQPQTSELQANQKVINAVGRLNTPNLVEYDYLAANVIDSYENSTLYTRANVSENNPEKTQPVEGGLMSGLGITAISGDMWNKCVTDLIILILHKILGIPLHIVIKFIKGDDSELFSKYPRVLQLIELMFRLLNIKGGIGKFSISWGNNEFLRTWVSDRCYGYPGRVIPGLMQRKPWSNAPWSGTMVLDAVFKDVQILRRRILDQTGLNRFWKFFSERWCQLHNIPNQAISIPKSLGGLGVGIWNGIDHIVPKIPQVPKYKIRLTNGNKSREDRIIARAKFFDIEIDSKDAEFLASNEMVDNLVSDDILKSSRQLRETWKSEILNTKFKILEGRKPNININIKKLPDYPDAIKYVNQQNRSSFGSLTHEVNELLSIKPILNHKRISIKHIINNSTKFPKLKAVLNTETNYHIGELLDWYGGIAPLALNSLNPLFNNTLSLMITKQMSYISKRKCKLLYATCSLTGILEPQLINTELYQRTALW